MGTARAQVVVNALDNIEARTYVDNKCSFHGKPLLESGTTGTMANVQVVIPRKTEAYSDSTDFAEAVGVPQCTIRSGSPRATLPPSPPAVLLMWRGARFALHRVTAVIFSLCSRHLCIRFSGASPATHACATTNSVHFIDDTAYGQSSSPRRSGIASKPHTGLLSLGHQDYSLSPARQHKRRQSANWSTMFPSPPSRPSPSRLPSLQQLPQPDHALHRVVCGRGYPWLLQPALQAQRGPAARVRQRSRGLPGRATDPHEH